MFELSASVTSTLDPKSELAGMVAVAAAMKSSAFSSSSVQPSA